MSDVMCILWIIFGIIILNFIGLGLMLLFYKILLIDS